MPYTLGELKERITLERKTKTRDGAGGATVTWASYATVWALVRPMTGRERESAMRTEARAEYLVVIRNRDDILESDRIGWRGRKLNIAFLKNKGPRTAFLEMEAEIGSAS